MFSHSLQSPKLLGFPSGSSVPPQHRTSKAQQMRQPPTNRLAHSYTVQKNYFISFCLSPPLTQCCSHSNHTHTTVFSALTRLFAKLTPCAQPPDVIEVHRETGESPQIQANLHSPPTNQKRPVLQASNDQWDRQHTIQPTPQHPIHQRQSQVRPPTPHNLLLTKMFRRSSYFDPCAPNGVKPPAHRMLRSPSNCGRRRESLLIHQEGEGATTSKNEPPTKRQHTAQVKETRLQPSSGDTEKPQKNMEVCQWSNTNKKHLKKTTIPNNTPSLINIPKASRSRHKNPNAIPSLSKKQNTKYRSAAATIHHNKKTPQLLLSYQQLSLNPLSSPPSHPHSREADPLPLLDSTPILLPCVPRNTTTSDRATRHSHHRRRPTSARPATSEGCCHHSAIHTRPRADSSSGVADNNSSLRRSQLPPHPTVSRRHQRATKLQDLQPGDNADGTSRSRHSSLNNSGVNTLIRRSTLQGNTQPDKYQHTGERDPHYQLASNHQKA